MSSRRYSDFALYTRFLREARPYWWHMAGLGALDLLGVPLLLLAPLPLKIAVDSVLGSEPLPGVLETIWPGTGRSAATTLVLVAAFAIGVPLLDKLRAFVNWVLFVRTSEQLAMSFKRRLFHHLQRLSLSYHDRAGTADAVYRIDRDADSIKKIALGLTPYVVALATLVSMLYVTLRIDWQLSLVALAGSPLAMILIATQRRRVRDRWNDVFEHQSRALSVIHEVLAAVRVVKAFGREEREEGRYIRHSDLYVRGQVSAARIEGGLDVAINLIFTLSSTGALLLGIWHIQQGRLTVGELLVVMTYVASLYAPLDLLSRFSSDLQSAFAAAARACSVLDTPPEIVDRPGARPLVRVPHAVEFRDVCFSYGRGNPAVQHLSFRAPAGSRVGVSGPTGAGKTTVVNLLARFYDPTEGKVLIDGIDLRDYRLSDLRDQIAIVLQEPVLFSTSIAENIAYARSEATFDEIVAAAQAANADTFIRALPDGYDTQVGDRGVRLSGGERQRISLARAFLKDSPILILDEPTSSVDVGTELQITEAMKHLMHGRTSFMIAHRLSTLDICDVRLELDHGRLVSFAKGPAVSPLTLAHRNPPAAGDR
jgi:ATP-binding cassette subfamily B protein